MTTSVDRCHPGESHRQHHPCHVVVQIGAAAVPPIALLAAVHGIALAVRAGASGTVYHFGMHGVAGCRSARNAVSSCCRQGA